MVSVLDSINEGLTRSLQEDPLVLVLGEDILDPYGGAFKVTRGLSSQFPDRVITTPISEAGFVGVACGLALRGFHPVVEVMFGDFSTLIVDQLVNHAAKFRWISSGRVQVPLVVRTPMGGRRGYGATHSQSLEKLFLGVPGLKVMAPTAVGDPGELLRAAIAAPDPVFFVEHKSLYGSPLGAGSDEFDVSRQGPLDAPSYRVWLQGAPPSQVTIVAFGFAAELAKEAMRSLAYEHEVFVELIVPTQLYPFDASPVIDSVRETGRVLTVEEGTTSYGWGSEVLAETGRLLGARVTSSGRVGALEVPIPGAPVLEREVLPSRDRIVAAASALLGGAS
jgi:pyruvate/2-oxoglutarate/acetoin dehydrogenase E1 component